MQLLRIIVANFAATASLAGLYISTRPPGPIGEIETLVILLAAAVSSWLTYQDYTVHYQKSTYSADKIVEFMRDIIKQEGRKTIVTHDMSWAKTGSETEQLLLEQARSNNLRILMKRETDLSRKLASEGAELSYYGDLVPTARFTINNSGRADERIAIGTKNKNGDFDVYSYSRGEHVAFNLASDLVRALAYVQDRRSKD